MKTNGNHILGRIIYVYGCRPFKGVKCVRYTILCSVLLRSSEIIIYCFWCFGVFVFVSPPPYFYPFCIFWFGFYCVPRTPLDIQKSMSISVYIRYIIYAKQKYMNKAQWKKNKKNQKMHNLWLGLYIRCTLYRRGTRFHTNIPTYRYVVCVCRISIRHTRAKSRGI